MPAHVYGLNEQDRTYHGIQHSPETADDGVDWQPARLLVEPTALGPTQRATVVPLREVTEPGTRGFAWGFDGNGTSVVAAVILADALDLPAATFGMYDDGDGQKEPAELSARMREDFVVEVLAVAADEFRLRRSAVLRWIRDWYAEQGVTDLPFALLGQARTGSATDGTASSP